MIDWLRNPNHRIKFALALLIFSVIGWPLTAMTVFSSEPQGVLGLSWLAIILTAIDILATTDVRKEQNDNEESKDVAT